MWKSIKLLQVLNIVAYLSMVGVNFLANRIPIGGNTTGEVAFKYPNLFTPAPITFAIWGVIYILLGVFVIFQGFFTNKENKHLIEQIGFWFILSCVANISWIYAWHYEKIPLSLLLMLILLFSIIQIYLKLNIGKVKVEKKVACYVHLPFQVYLGWITIATLANITTLMVYFGWDGMGTTGVIWTIFLLILGTVLAYYMMVVKNDPIFSLVVLWAYLGIIIKRLSEGPAYPSLMVVTVLCMTAIVFFLTQAKDRT